MHLETHRKTRKQENWNSYLWAPDILYNPHMEKYCIYLSANGDEWVSNIVLLAADSVIGPYEYAGSVLELLEYLMLLVYTLILKKMLFHLKRGYAASAAE